MYDAYGSLRGSPHSSHSVIVSGSVGSLIVVTTSTNGTSAIAALNRSGSIGMQAPTSSPPALPPRIATRSGAATPIVTRWAHAASVSVNVLRLASSLPSRYQPRPSSPPPRGCTSAHVPPRSSHESLATENHGGIDASYDPYPYTQHGELPSSCVSTWRTMSTG